MPLVRRKHGTSPLLVFIDSTIDALGSGQSVFLLIDLTQRIDLFCADALCESSRGCYRVLAAKCDKAHFKGGHLGAVANSHSVARARIERRIPHLMT